MTAHGESRDDTMVPVQRQIGLLEARRDALQDLSRASTDLRDRLKHDPIADVSTLLDVRERECVRLASLASPGPDDRALEATGQAAEAGALAGAMLTLQAESEALAEDIIECQRECECLLRERLDSAARALRESVQRRKLDAAYGPACKHSTPAFLDRQQ